MGYDNKGDIYEKRIHEILIARGLTAIKRGGASDKPDVVVTQANGTNIFVECKSNGADYGQKMLNYKNSKWSWSAPDEITALYDHMKVFQNINPDFIPKNANHKNLPTNEWSRLRKKTITKEDKDYDHKSFKKQNIPMNVEVFFEYYKKRGCYYIQIDSLGFYHLSEDKYHLGTDQFNGEISLRFRAKSIHAHSYWVNGRQIKKKGEFEKIKAEKNSTLFKNEYEILETPWDYKFYAVMKLSIKPSKSKYSIEGEVWQKFPKF